MSQTYRRTIDTMLHNSHLKPDELLINIIPTGDGFYCILHPRYRGFGAILALSFNHLSELISNKFPYFRGIRIAVHTGEVHRFIDILGNENFVGYGLNECERYLSSQNHQISTVIISEEAYHTLELFLTRFKDFHSLLVELGFKFSPPFTFKDKHGILHTGYMIWMRKGGIINPPNLSRSKR